MSATHNFLIRTIYHSICAHIKLCKEVVAERKGIVPTGEHSSTVFELSGEVADEFFGSPVNADEAATVANPLAGIADYLERTGNMEAPIIAASTARETKFAAIPGDDVNVETLMDLLKKIRRARITYLVENMRQNEKEAKEKLDWLPHILIVFDEAHHLSSKLNPKVAMTVKEKKNLLSTVLSTDPFKIFRRVTRNSNFYWTYAWSITVSTNSSMSNFSPARADDPSVRASEKITIIPPFIYEGSFDIFAHENYRKIWLPVEGQELVVPQDAKEYIFSWKRVKHILSCGRPLFYSFVEAKMGIAMFERTMANIDEWPVEAKSAFDELLEVIVKKMNGGNSGALIKGTIEDKSLLFALFSGSVGMYAFPEVLLDREDMIRRRLCWVLSYNIETKDCEIAYPSEGIFNCVLSLLLNQHSTKLLEGFFDTDIFAFFNKPAFKKQYSYWQVTEVLARLVILLAFHHTLRMPIIGDAPKASHLSNLLHPRLAKDLLNKFALRANDTSEIDKFFKALGKEYEGAMTTFGYFQEVREVGNPLEFVQSMLFRGSAKYFPNARQPGADAVLPLVMPDGSYGVILVQVKGVQANVVGDGKWPTKKDDITAAMNAGITEVTCRNSFVKKSMRLCTIEGAFGARDQSTVIESVDQSSSATEIPHKRTRDSSGKFVKGESSGSGGKGASTDVRELNIKHCIRLIINLKTFIEADQPRIRFFRDLNGPVLAIQTDGTLPFLEQSQSNFVKNALSFKKRDWEGNLSRYEAHLGFPTADDKDGEPYNSAFFGHSHDDESCIAKSRGVEELLYGPRPRNFYPRTES